MHERREVFPGPVVAACVLLAAAPMAGQAPPPAADQAPASPVAILLQMERAYRACRTYRDRGEVSTRILTEGGRAGSERPFATVFVRSGGFRFQFTDTGLGERESRYVVWSDGNEVRSWWDAQPGVRHPASLREALAVATGISGGSSMRVPGLLMRDVVGGGPLLVAPERIEDGAERGVDCFRIRGKSQKTPYTLTMGAQLLTVKDETVTLWIAKATRLLRKVEEDRTYDTYRSESVTTYTPEVDGEIPASELAFDFPGEKP